MCVCVSLRGHRGNEIHELINQHSGKANQSSALPADWLSAAVFKSIALCVCVCLSVVGSYLYVVPKSQQSFTGTALKMSILPMYSSATSL